MSVIIDENTRNMIFKMSNVFFNIFSSYSSFSIECALKKLPKKQK